MILERFFIWLLWVSQRHISFPYQSAVWDLHYGLDFLECSCSFLLYILPLICMCTPDGTSGFSYQQCYFHAQSLVTMQPMDQYNNSKYSFIITVLVHGLHCLLPVMVLDSTASTWLPAWSFINKQSDKSQVSTWTLCLSGPWVYHQYC